jgi:hypothetical protein
MPNAFKTSQMAVEVGFHSGNPFFGVSPKKSLDEMFLGGWAASGPTGRTPLMINQLFYDRASHGGL